MKRWSCALFVLPALIACGGGSSAPELSELTLSQMNIRNGDEFFASESAAKRGIVIRNTGAYEPLVILQNFANNNPAVPETV